MKDTIKEFIELTDEEKNKLWETATFVFDTNVLLNLYRYTKNTRETLFDAMESLKERIWMPYQVAYEFMKNRTEIIFDTVNKYSSLNAEKENFLRLCSEKLRINSKDKEYKKLNDYIDKWIKNNQKNNLLVTNPSEDVILNRVLELFDSKTGKPFNSEQLSVLFEEGKQRYEKQIPPGYKDNKKQENEFGDFIVWKQIMNYAKDNKKDIIYITNDRKEDWWNIVFGKSIGPRIELRKEFVNTTNKKFHIYSMESFINQYEKHTNTSIDKEIVDELVFDPFKGSGEFLLSALNHLADTNDNLFMGRSNRTDLMSDRKRIQKEIRSIENKNKRRYQVVNNTLSNYDGIMPSSVEEMIINTNCKIEEGEQRISLLKEKLYKLNRIAHMTER